LKLEDILSNPSDHDLACRTLGPNTVDNPLVGQRFVEEDEKVALTAETRILSSLAAKGLPVPALEKAGPQVAKLRKIWSCACIPEPA